MILPWERPSGASPYIIAEIGVNHDGDVNRALKLVELAHDVGADAIKLQFFRSDLLLSSAARLASYQQTAGERDPCDMLRRLELESESLFRVADRARSLGLDPIVTVFTESLVSEINRFDWSAFKTASPDLIHRPLLDALIQTQRPLILSTGASTIAEVRSACGWLGDARSRAAALHCVSAYPTPDPHARLGAIRALHDARIPVSAIGYSDHTTSETTGAIAAALGASILEKHLTYDRGATGPDHSASLDGDAFDRYVRHARRLDDDDPADVLSDLMPDGERDSRFGAPTKDVDRIEMDVRVASRQSITSVRHIPCGMPVTRDLITFKRPGTGISPSRLSEVIGRFVVRDLDPDVPICDNDLR